MKNQKSLALCALAAFLALSIAGAFAPYMLSFDEGTYWQTLRLLSEGRALYREIFYSQFPPFIEFAHFFFRLGGDSLPFARMATTLWALVGLGAAYWIGLFFERREHLKNFALYFFLLLLTDNLYFHLGHELIGDASSTGIFLLALAFSLHAGESPRPLTWIALAALTAAVAVLFKAVVLPLFFFLALVWLWVGITRDRRGLHVLLPSLLGGFIFLGAFLSCLWAAGYFSAGGLAQLQGGTVHNFLQIPSDSTAGWKLMIFALHSGGHFDFGNLLVLPAALLSLALLWKNPRLGKITKLVSLGILLMLAAVLRHKNINWYHFVIFSPVLAFATALYASTSNAPWGRRILYLVLAVNIGLIAGSFLFLEEQKRIDGHKQEIIRALQACTSPGASVISDDIYAVAAANRDSPPPLADISWARLYYRSVTCETLGPWLIDPRVEAVVATSPLRTIDCGESEFTARVKKEFPITALDRKFAKVYVRKTCSPVSIK